MFVKEPKKTFPAGTFLPIPQRILAIFHLCLAFITICMYVGYPFMGALFDQKAQLSVFESLMGTLPEPLSIEARRQQHFNHAHFARLSAQEKEDIQSAYHHLQQEGNRSFWAKCLESCDLLAFKAPPFVKAWMFFSVLLAILMLRKREGATQAAWVLPIIASAFAFDAYQKPPKNWASPDAGLFPSEQTIIRAHLDHPLSSHILEQHAQLKKGWNHYLIVEWAKELPATDPSAYTLQIFKGEFAFNLARLKVRMQHPAPASSFLLGVSYNPLPFYLLYFLWNLFFAWFMNRNIGRPIGLLPK